VGGMRTQLPRCYRLARWTQKSGGNPFLFFYVLE